MGWSWDISYYRKAAEIGLLGLGFSEELFLMQIHFIHYWLVLKWQFWRSTYLTHGTHNWRPSHFGSEELKARVLPEIISGVLLWLLQNLVVARMSLHYSYSWWWLLYCLGWEDVYQIRADYYTVAVRTDPTKTEAFQCCSLMRTVKELLKHENGMVGFWYGAFVFWSSTASNLLGKENAGFKVIMNIWNGSSWE